MKFYSRLLLFFFLISALPARSATITWVNTSGGNWSNTNNWSPHQLPTNIDTVLITTPGTYTINFDLSSGVFPLEVSNLTLGAVSGVQTLMITNLTPQYQDAQVNGQLLVTNGGVLAMTNGVLEGNPVLVAGGVIDINNAFLGGNVWVENGGVLNSWASSSTGMVTVTNSGVINAGSGFLVFSSEPSYDLTFENPVTVARGGVLNISNRVQVDNFTVAAGGTMNIASPDSALYAYGLINNSGNINLTNGQLQLIAYTSLYVGMGAMNNLPGGVVNLQEDSQIIGATDEGTGIAYLTNTGVMISDGTNSISSTGFDDTHGVVTNLSGVLDVGIFTNAVEGNYYAAARSTIQLSGADEANNYTSTSVTLDPALSLAGPGAYQLVSGYLYLTSNVPQNLMLVCDSVTLAPQFQGGAITNLAVSTTLLNALPITGSLRATNAEIEANVLIQSGGTATLAFSGDNEFTIPINGSLTVNHGGTVNLDTDTRGYIADINWTNAGTINLSNGYLYLGQVLNQSGGVISLSGSGGMVAVYPTDWFTNRGTLVQLSGTNEIDYETQTNFGTQNLLMYAPMGFDTSQGTISNLSGTLTLPSFGGTISGNFYAAAGATIQLGGGTGAAPLTPGSPLTLGGGGLYQFISGYLYYATTALPNIELAGGQLALGPDFQGGALTNLYLAGITVTNAFPIKGNVSLVNNGSENGFNGYDSFGFYGNGYVGNLLVEGPGFLTLSNSPFSGSLLVTNGGVVNAEAYSSFYGPITVANGGFFDGQSVQFYGGADVQSGGVMNPEGGSTFSMPLTNAGTINLTNSSLGVYNDGTTNNRGAIYNLASGAINFEDSTVAGQVGSSLNGPGPMVNQGRITFATGAGIAGVVTSYNTNSGSISAGIGTLVLEGTWDLLSGGSLDVTLDGAGSYGNFTYTTNYPDINGTLPLGGAFEASLGNGYVPVGGTSFNVLRYGAYSGTFSSLSLPEAVSWETAFGPTNLELTVAGSVLEFGNFGVVGTNVVLTGSGGMAAAKYDILASTNLALPLASWTLVGSNSFDANGNFAFTNGLNKNLPRRFFRLQTSQP